MQSVDWSVNCDEPLISLLRPGIVFSLNQSDYRYVRNESFTVNYRGTIGLECVIVTHFCPNNPLNTYQTVVYICPYYLF